MSKTLDRFKKNNPEFSGSIKVNRAETGQSTLERFKSNNPNYKDQVKVEEHKTRLLSPSFSDSEARAEALRRMAASTVEPTTTTENRAIPAQIATNAFYRDNHTTPSATVNTGTSTPYRYGESVIRDRLEKTTNPLSNMTAEQIIAEYESIPERNAVDRLANAIAVSGNGRNGLPKLDVPDYNKDYARKQELQKSYDAIKTEEAYNDLLSMGYTEEDFYDYGHSYVTDAEKEELRKQGKEEWEIEAYEKERSKKANDILNKITDDVKAQGKDTKYYYAFLDDYKREGDIRYAKDNPVEASVGSLMLNPIESTLNVAEKVTDYATGAPITSNQSVTNTLREGAAENFDTQFGKTGYMGAMSIGDTAVAVLAAQATGGGSIVSAGMQAIEKASQVLDESAQRDITPNQIMALGVASGITTYLTEKIPMGQIDNIINNGISSYTAKEISKTILAQMVSEGLQEPSEDLADWLADYIITRDKNQFNADIQKYMADGMIKEEALAKVIGDSFEELGTDALFGALGGLTLGGGGVALGYTFERAKDTPVVQTDIINAKDNAEALNMLSDTAKTLDTESLPRNTDEEIAYAERIEHAKEVANKPIEELTDEDIVDMAMAVNEMANTENNYANTINEINYQANLNNNLRQYSESGAIQQKEGELPVETLARQKAESIAVDYEEGLKRAQKNYERSMRDFKINGLKSDIGRSLTNFAENFENEVAAKNFLDNYKGQDPSRYAEVSLQAYNAGESGQSFKTFLENSITADMMVKQGEVTEAYLKTLYYNGLNNIEAEETPVLRKNENRGKVTGQTEDNALADFEGKVAQKLGIEVARDLTDAVMRGNFSAALAKITLNVTSDSEYSALVHEMFEFARAYNPKGMQVAQRTLLDMLVKKSNEREFLDAVNAYKDTYRSVAEKKGGEFISEAKKSISGATEEFINDAISYIFSTKEGMQNLVNYIMSDNNTTQKEKVSAIQAIKDWIDHLIATIKNFVSKNKTKVLGYAYAERAGFSSEELEALSRMLTGVLDDARANLASATEKITENSKNSENVAHSLTVEEKSGVEINGDGEMRFSVAVYENEGKDYLREYLQKYSGLTKKDQKDIIETLDWGYEIAKEMQNNPDMISFSNWSDTQLEVDATGKPLLEVFLKNGRPLRSAVVNNGEYPLNIDFSQVCKKRIALNTVLNKLVSDADLNLAILTESDIAGINRLIKEHEFEIACGLCFVDSKRYRVGSWANSFVNGKIDEKTHKKESMGWNDLVMSMIPKGAEAQYFNLASSHVTPLETLLDTLSDDQVNFKTIDKIIKPYLNKKGTLGPATEEARMAYLLRNNPSVRMYLDPNDIIASEGLDMLRAKYKDVYLLVNSHGGQAKPKLSHGFTAYGNDILKAQNWKGSENQFLKPDAYAVGGVRVQSFSDYVANLFFDYMQMFADMSARELPSHAYTKEATYVRLFGMTGQRINMSIIFKGANLTQEQSERLAKLLAKGREYVLADEEFGPLCDRAGLDENGNYILEDESFDLATAIAIQNDPNYKYCGTVGVGLSNMHIRKMLNDDNIKMVIPYHASGVSQLIKNARNLGLYTDYTEVQNTRGRDGKTLEKGDGFDWYGRLKSEINPNGLDAKAVADEYLKYCDEMGYTPKFDAFRDHPNYYKLLIDFRAYDNDGNFMPQGPVKMNFPEEAEFKKLVSESLMEQQKTEDRMEKEMSGEQNTLYKEVKDFLKEQGTLEENVRHSFAVPSDNVAKHDYSYDTLKNKSDIPINDPSELGLKGLIYSSEVSQSDIIEAVRNNIKKYNGGTSNNTLYNDDLGSVVQIGRKGIIHHKRKIDQRMIDSVVNLPTYFKDAIVLNEANGKNDADNTFILFGAYEDDKGLHITRSVVERYNGESELTDYSDYLYATKTKTDEARDTVTTGKPSQPHSVSKLTVTQLLNAVKRTFPNDLSQDVANHLEYKRGDSDIKGIKYSLSVTDNTGRTLSEGQQKKFAESQARDEEGRLMEMYHGTPGQEFDVFDRNKSDDKRSFFFSSNREVAETYARGGAVMPVYLDLRNPLIINAEGSNWSKIKYEEGESFKIKPTRVGEYLFLNEEDADAFGRKHHFTELQKALEVAEEEDSAMFMGKEHDVFELERLFEEAEKEYAEYHYQHSRPVRFKDFFDNYTNYSWRDFYSLMMAYDRNLPSLEEMKQEGDYEDVVEMAKEALTEDNDADFFESMFANMLPAMDEVYTEQFYANTRKLAQLAEESGKDGVIIRNVYDTANGKAIKSDVMIAFKPNQVKSVYNLNPTESDNKRYSFDVSGDDFFNSFMEVDEEVKKTESALKEMIKKQKDLESDVSKKMISDVASYIKKKYNSNYKTKNLENSISAVFQYLQNNNAKMDDILYIMSDIAKPILQDVKATDPELEKLYNDMVSKLKTYNISLDAGQRQEVANSYGTYKNFVDSMRGKLNISKKGTPLDNVWSEICDASGGLLSYGTVPNEQPIALANLINGLNPSYSALEGQSLEDASMDVALEIIRQFYVRNSLTGAAETLQGELTKRANKFKNEYKQRYNEALKQVEAEKAINIKRLAEEIDNLTAEQQEAIRSGDVLNKAVIENLRNQYVDRLNKLRTQSNDKIAQAQAKYRNAWIDKNLRRERSQLKNRVLREVKALQNMIAHPAEGATKHVPINLIKPTIEMLEAINLDNNGRNKAIAERLKKMSEVYESFKNDDRYSFDYDERIANDIKELREIFENKSYADLGIQELERVIEIVTALKTQIKNANNLILQGKYKDAQEAASNAMTEVRGSRKHDNATMNLLNRYGNVHLNAYREFRKLSGYRDGSLMEIYRDLDEGSHKEMQIQKDLGAIFQDVLEGNQNQKEIKKFISTKKGDLVDIGLTDKNGKPILITRAMRMSLIMHSMNEGNMRHVLGSGITIPNMYYFEKGKMDEAYAKGTNYRFVDYAELLDALQRNDTAKIEELTTKAQERIDKMKEDLSDWEKRFLADAEEMFHERTGEYINETSMALKGYAIARVKNYFPIKTDPHFTSQDWTGLVQNGSLEGAGPLKERVISTKPILLEDITNVIERQIRFTSKYAGLAVPIRNFDTIMKQTSRNQTNGQLQNLYETIDTVWGASDTKWLRNLMQDLQGGRSEKGNWLMNLRGQFAGATLTLNPSVAIKQAASYPTAAAVVGWNPLRKAMADIAKGFGGNGIAELEAINPLLWYRAQGYGTQELADAKAVGFGKNLPTWAQKAINWTQWFDTGTVRTLEYAAKYYVDDNYKNLEKGSEEYWQKVSEVFTNIVEQTQPNYSTLHKADIVRNPNSFVKMLVMFKTQPMQNFGVIYDAMGELNAAKVSGDKQWVKEASSKAAYAISSQVVSATVFSAMTILSQLLLHRWWKYRDEDGEWNWNKLLVALGEGVMSCFTGAFIGGTVIYDLLKAMFTEETTYGIEISVVEMVNDLRDNISKLYKNNKELLKAKTSEDREKLTQKELKYAINVASSIGEYTGTPVNNIKNIVSSMYFYATDIIKSIDEGELSISDDSNLTTWEIETQYERIYQAFANGDNERYEKLVNELKAKEKDENPDLTEDEITAKVEDAVTKKITSMMKADYLEGNISDEEMSDYLQEEKGKTEDEAFFTMREWETDLSKYQALKEGIKTAVLDPTSENWDTVNTEANFLMEHGVDESDINTKYNEVFKELYRNQEITYDQLTEMLKERGKTKDEAYFTIREWETGESTYGILKDSISTASKDLTPENRKAVLAEVKNLKEHGKDKSDIGQTITTNFKEEYIELYKKGKAADLNSILRAALVEAGYTDDQARKKLNDWVK